MHGSEHRGAMQLIEWRWRALGEFEPRALYQMLALRQRIFIVEQSCIYQDADGLDDRTEHLTGYDGEHLACCLRVLPPGLEGAQASIGRVAVARGYRGQGLAREMMARALAHIHKRHGAVPVGLSAQHHLEAFYTSLGFDTVSEPYDEDGIPHIDMLLEHA